MDHLGVMDVGVIRGVWGDESKKAGIDDEMTALGKAVCVVSTHRPCGRIHALAVQPSIIHELTITCAYPKLRRRTVSSLCTLRFDGDTVTCILYP